MAVYPFWLFGSNIFANNLFFDSQIEFQAQQGVTNCVLVGNNYATNTLIAAVGGSAGGGLTNYFTMAAFRAGTGFEAGGTGTTNDPKCWSYTDSNLTNQQLQSSSLLKGAAVSLLPYGVVIPTTDIQGNSTSPNSIGAFAQ